MPHLTKRITDIGEVYPVLEHVFGKDNMIIKSLESFWMNKNYLDMVPLATSTPFIGTPTTDLAGAIANNVYKKPYTTYKDYLEWFANLVNQNLQNPITMDNPKYEFTMTRGRISVTFPNDFAISIIIGDYNSSIMVGWVPERTTKPERFRELDMYKRAIASGFSGFEGESKAKEE